jgi:hypothetical protein
VIEFALLFGLGFLSALLITMLVAPAIYRRIVFFTENRIRATVPISPQEVRAQRDMARALYAAENARTKQDLQQERDKSVSLKLKSESLQEDIKDLVATNLDLKTRLETMDVDAADLRSQLRREDSYISELKATLEAAEDGSVGKDLELEDLRKQIEVLAANGDNARIDLSTRETEVENLKFRISTLREERESLRQDVRLQTTRAKDAETRLAQEEHRSMRLEDKLAKEVSLRTDKETALERRNEEIARLRDKLKGRDDAAPPFPDERQKKMAGDAAAPLAIADDDTAADVQAAVPISAAKSPAGADFDAPVALLAGDAKNRATALSERLLHGKGGVNDAALREEMATIAAGMVAMTALAEGEGSPIHAMVAGKPAAGKRKSLGARVRTLLEKEGESAGR